MPESSLERGLRETKEMALKFDSSLKIINRKNEQNLNNYNQIKQKHPYYQI